MRFWILAVGLLCFAGFFAFNIYKSAICDVATACASRGMPDAGISTSPAPERFGVDCTGSIVTVGRQPVVIDFVMFRQVLLFAGAIVEESDGADGPWHTLSTRTSDVALDVGKRFLRVRALAHGTGSVHVLPRCRRIPGCCEKETP